MNSRDIFGLYEAYRSVYEDQLDEAPYQVYGPDPHGPSDAPTKPLGKPHKDRKSARRKADKLDQEVGGYKHSVSYVPEEVDLYDIVLDHLLDEGYCDDVESAEIIMTNMSEEWVNEIVEGVADKKLPPEKRAQTRNERTFTYIKGHDATRARRKEHRERRGVRGNIGGEGGANWRYDDEKSEKDYPSFRVRGRGYA